MIVVDGLINIGQGLSFNPLRGINDRDRTLAARSQRTANLIGKITWPGVSINSVDRFLHP